MKDKIYLAQFYYASIEESRLVLIYEFSNGNKDIWDIGDSFCMLDLDIYQDLIGEYYK